MRLVAGIKRTAMHPRAAVASLGFDVEIRTGIGRSVLFLTLAAGVALLAFVLG
jgi:multicomponent Na+:H+ antiporter subunit D